MVVLLECQKVEESCEIPWLQLKVFAIAMLCSLLEIYETDLTTDEQREIEHFCKDWTK